MTTAERPVSTQTPSEAVRPAAKVAVAAVVASAAGGLAGAAIAPWAGFVVLAAIGVLLVCLRDPRAALLCVIAVVYLLPFGVIPVPLGGVRLTFLDATLILALLAWLLRLLTRHEDRPVFTALALPLLVFVILAVVSFVLGSESASPEVVRLFLKAINSILVFFTVLNIVRERVALRWIVIGLLAAGTGAALLALGLYVLPPATARTLLNSLGRLGYPTGQVLRYIADTTTLRAIGTAVDPNVLGGMLLVLLPLGVSQVSSARPVLDRQLLVAMTGAIGLALLLSFSRGSWFGAAVGCLFLGTVRYRRIWLALGVLVAALLILPQGQPYVERFMAGVQFQDKASLMRLGEYKDALRLIERYPWLGVGFGRAPDIDVYIGASSIYFMMAVEMGITGLTAFLGLIMVFFRTTLRARPFTADPQVDAIRLGLLAAVTGALAAGLFDHFFFNIKFPHTAAIFWMLLGLAVAATRILTGEAKKSQETERLTTTAASPFP